MRAIRLDLVDVNQRTFRLSCVRTVDGHGQPVSPTMNSAGCCARSSIVRRRDHRQNVDGVISWNAGAQRSCATRRGRQAVIADHSRRSARRAQRILEEIKAGRRVASHETIRVTRQPSRAGLADRLADPRRGRACRRCVGHRPRHHGNQARRGGAPFDQERYRSIIAPAVDAVW